MKPAALIALATLCVGPALDAAQSQSLPAEFAVAVLRQDGGLIPIANFTGRRWEVSWTSDPIDRIDIPITLESIPHAWWGKPGQRDNWQLFANGVDRGTAHIVRPVVLPTMCEGRVGLLTDRRDPAAPTWNVQPYPKTGLAVSPPIPVAPIEVLDADAPDRAAVATTLKSTFDDAEDRLANEWMAAGDPHPIDRKERLNTPVAVEEMYASGPAAQRVYYVEASRKYDHSSRKRPVCAVAFAGVFFERERDRFVPVGIDLRVVSCERQGILYMLPLGAMQIKGHTYWVAQLSNWTYEGYTVIQFKRPRTEFVASAIGGRCSEPTR